MFTFAANDAENPFFKTYEKPYGAPPFDLIKVKHYMPAFQEGIKQQNQEINALVSNPAIPTFENTIAALDFSGELLRKVNLVFFSLTESETNDEMTKIAEQVTPILSEHGDNIYLNAQLFARVKILFEKKASLNLTREQERLLEDTYKKFVRSGASLKVPDQARLREINKDLSLLTLKFSDNVLNEINSFRLVIDNKSDLSGLPQSVVDAASESAQAVGLRGKWLFTLHIPSLIPFLQYADNRALREKMYKAYISKGDNDQENDNKKVVDQIVNDRIERAKMLGFQNHAAYVLDENMAKNPETVMPFLDGIWKRGLAQAKKEVLEMQQMIQSEGKDFKLQAWDWWYYSEKVRKARFNLDESEIKPFFQLENVRQGAFTVANKLYGIQFEKVDNVPVYHPDVEVFKVMDADGSYLGLFYSDYFPRSGKRSGAWMGNFRDAYVKNGKEVRPFIYNVGNFTKPTADAPSLLNEDEVKTLFHEFGHGLHGLLTKCQYISTSGTNVAQDFVELPSQVMENWAMHPDVLKYYAKHYQTGAVIPDSLIEKIRKAGTFNQGFMTTELVAAALLDMDWHTQTKKQTFDVRAFEKSKMDSIGLIDEIAPRYRSTYFNHIFSGGYSAGYYAYLWAEVLDADAFEAFVEKGIFDKATATAFRKYILERGDSEDPMVLYRKFRGANPNPEALLKRRGL
ncbi:MAG: M3 family metallopeptidase [Bacteroidales bacterium]|nr:M3 family metallopeptidase [Bacteroidales bacterium]